MSRATRFAAVWLVGIGVLLVGAFVWGLLVEHDWEAGIDPMDGIVVVVFGTAAAAHIVAGVGVWRGHRWGAVLGSVFAVVGLLFSLLGLLEEWFAVLPLACYVVTLVVLLQAQGRPELPAE